MIWEIQEAIYRALRVGLYISPYETLIDETLIASSGWLESIEVRDP